jgi:hypothetical protein
MNREEILRRLTDLRYEYRPLVEGFRRRLLGGENPQIIYSQLVEFCDKNCIKLTKELSRGIATLCINPIIDCQNCDAWRLKNVCLSMIEEEKSSRKISPHEYKT